MSSKSFWDSEELLSELETALIALYEQPREVEVLCRRANGAEILEEGGFRETLATFRKSALTLVHPSRIILNPETEGHRLNLKLDPVPRHPFNWFNTVNESARSRGSYASCVGIDPNIRLPQGWRQAALGKNIKVYYLEFRNTGGVITTEAFVTIDRTGRIVPCIPDIMKGARVSDDWDNAKMEFRELCYSGVFFAADARHTWKVKTKDDSGRIDIQAYAEELKSLFYARTLPLTRTGRRAPLLHWVSAHQRRLKNGTDIDIEQYLRGRTQFKWENIKFEIVPSLDLQ